MSATLSDIAVVQARRLDEYGYGGAWMDGYDDAFYSNVLHLGFRCRLSYALSVSLDGYWSWNLEYQREMKASYPSVSFSFSDRLF